MDSANASIRARVSQIRLTSCGSSVGTPYSIEPRLGDFSNQQNWDIHDYVIYAAGQYGLRIILPLVENYDL